MLAVVCGLVVGKTLIHGLILSRFLRLKMFRADQVRQITSLLFYADHDEDEGAYVMSKFCFVFAMSTLSIFFKFTSSFREIKVGYSTTLTSNVLSGSLIRVNALLQGSWMVQFLTVILSLFLFSHAYNVLLVVTFPSAKAFTVTSEMYLTSST